MEHRGANPMWIALTCGTVEARSRSYGPGRTERVTREEAAWLLGEEVRRAVADGARVDHTTDGFAILSYGKPPNHVLHLLLTLVTFGLWLVVWIIAGVVASKPARMMVTVDEFGNITRTPTR